MDKQVVLVSIAAITLVAMTILQNQKPVIFHIPDTLVKQRVAEGNIKQRNSGDYGSQIEEVKGNLTINHYPPDNNQQQSSHGNGRPNNNRSPSTQSPATGRSREVDLTQRYITSGESLYKNRRFEDAAEYYKLAIRNEIKAHGKNSRDILILKNKLANSYLWSGKPEEAIEIYHNVIDIYSAEHGNDLRDLEPVFRNLGEAYVKLSDTLKSPYH